MSEVALLLLQLILAVLEQLKLQTLSKAQFLSFPVSIAIKPDKV